MPHARQKTGGLGEAAARTFLERHGYEILAQNWHAGRWGEIDIIAIKEGELVFVEVKARRGTGFGYPEEAVTRAKQDKLKGAAQAFLISHPHLPQSARFDVLAIMLSTGEQVIEVKHYKSISLLA